MFALDPCRFLRAVVTFDRSFRFRSSSIPFHGVVVAPPRFAFRLPSPGPRVRLFGSFGLDPSFRPRCFPFGSDIPSGFLGRRRRKAGGSVPGKACPVFLDWASGSIRWWEGWVRVPHTLVRMLAGAGGGGRKCSNAGFRSGRDRTAMETVLVRAVLGSNPAPKGPQGLRCQARVRGSGWVLDGPFPRSGVPWEGWVLGCVDGPGGGMAAHPPHLPRHRGRQGGGGSTHSPERGEEGRHSKEGSLFETVLPRSMPPFGPGSLPTGGLTPPLPSLLPSRQPVSEPGWEPVVGSRSDPTSPGSSGRVRSHELHGGGGSAGTTGLHRYGERTCTTCSAAGAPTLGSRSDGNGGGWDGRTREPPRARTAGGKGDGDEKTDGWWRSKRVCA